jgi:phosphatidylglycerophosphate synthase
VVATGTGLAANLAALLGLLAALSTTVGLGPTAWAVGLLTALVVAAVVTRALARRGAVALGPADLVTLFRATLTSAAAALVTESYLGQPVTTPLVGLAVTALVLDAVDGPVARRTRTTSGFGAVFDGEVDALLMLVLSAYVARSYGGWVLVIGVLRYVFAAAGWVLPWLRGQLPFRYWRKVVTAVQGIVLTAAAADVVPPALTYAALAVALALLVESFGRDVWWLWAQRVPRRVEIAGATGGVRLRPR